LVPAASTAAISSGSGGSGMFLGGPRGSRRPPGARVVLDAAGDDSSLDALRVEAEHQGFANGGVDFYHEPVRTAARSACTAVACSTDSAWVTLRPFPFPSRACSRR